MNVICSVFFFGVIFSSAFAVRHHHEIFARFENISKNCLEDLKLEQGDIVQFYDGHKQHQDKPKDENVLCYFKCVVQGFNFMNENGDYVENTEDYPEDILKSVDKCKGVTGTNPCDKGYKAAKCFMDAMEELHRPSH